ncbi:flagellar motor switch protein FliM [Ectobacillus ponti]|uniref:Flagellar motor switch protein FliM n=1 Tax=Ectobacillus ponti TaxID=2961894 RepID=A0AA42BPL1_9BACI|nr:flagellar motor switch protein FliM [Ectobacillus ponti]MCP8968862.1 flagellar motor switch protein FliM [Ectobacillus ponti]
MSGGDKLSQEQIDALLKAMQEGAEVPNFEEEIKEEEKFQEYDFNRPEKFGIEHLRSLQTIASNFGKTFIQNMSARLRMPVEMEPSTVEQVPFMNEYVEKMPKDYYAYSVVNLGHPELGEIIVEMDLAFIIYLHECWLGGDPRRDFQLRRPLTTFEMITLRNLFVVINEQLRQAFGNVADIEPRLVTTETTPTALKVTTPSDIISLLNVNIRTEHWNTTVRIGIPFLSIEPIMDELTAENIVEHASDKRKHYSKEVEQELKKVKKPVHISIGERRMTIADLQQLEEGDIIPLGTKITDKLGGYVAGKRKFECLIGREGHKKAFLFQNYVEE